MTDRIQTFRILNEKEDKKEIINKKNDKEIILLKKENNNLKKKIKILEESNLKYKNLLLKKDNLIKEIIETPKYKDKLENN